MQVVRVPGCQSLDCPLDEFLSAVVGDKASSDELDKVCGVRDLSELQPPIVS